MILNDADNIMYGEKEVDAVYYGKWLVWERIYKWINDAYNNIIKFRYSKKPVGEIYLNYCVEPYTVTNPVTLPKWSTYDNIPMQYYNAYGFSALESHNIFGDEIISYEIDIDKDVVYKEKPADFFENTDLIINNNICTKIPKYAFAFRKLNSISFPTNGSRHGDNYENVIYSLAEIGDYAFFQTEVNSPKSLLLSSVCSSWSGSGAINISPRIGKYAFYQSNVPSTLITKSVANNFVSLDVEIGLSAFRECSSIEYVGLNTANNGILTIHTYAFCDCENLQQVNFAHDFEGTTLYAHNVEVNENAFAVCPKLTEIKFPGNCNIQAFGFDNCGLKYVEFNGNVTLATQSFGKCSEIQEIHFKSRTTSIDIHEYAFIDQQYNGCKFYVNGYNQDTVKPQLLKCGIHESNIILE